MKKKYKMILGGAVLLLVLVAVATQLLNAPAVSVETVTPGPLIEQFTETGSIVPRSRYTVDAKSSGIITDILASPGKVFAEGDPLFLIDDARYRESLQEQIDLLYLQQAGITAGGDSATSAGIISSEQLRQQLALMEQSYALLYGARKQAQSDYESAESAYSVARGNYEAGLALFELGAISQSELQALEAAYYQAQSAYQAASLQSSDEGRRSFEQQLNALRAQVSAAESGVSAARQSKESGAGQIALQIASLEKKRDELAVTAPFSGVMGELLVRQGDPVSEYQPLAVLYGGTECYVEVYVLDEDAYGLREGAVARCTLTDGSSWEGTVIFVSGVVSQQTSTIGLSEGRRLVELSAAGIPAHAGIGSQTEVTFTSVVAAEVLSVPSSALLPYEDGSAVYVLSGGKLRLCPVETGTRAGGRVVITAGLADGDQVLQSPYADGVKDGARAKAG